MPRHFVGWVASDVVQDLQLDPEDEQTSKCQELLTQ
jgi:hypothetical protein